MCRDQLADESGKHYHCIYEVILVCMSVSFDYFEAHLLEKASGIGLAKLSS